MRWKEVLALVRKIYVYLLGRKEKKKKEKILPLSYSPIIIKGDNFVNSVRDELSGIIMNSEHA